MVGFWVQTLCRIIDDPIVTEERAAHLQVTDIPEWTMKCIMGEVG